MDLKGKVSIVTGGARGIGKAIAEMLVSAGSDMALFDVLEADLKTTAAELAAKGVRVETFKVNVTKSEEVEEAVKAVQASPA
jgi:NAD(P)-dependent dehydrogenase (short-subunit alcohol dehydrogenase family)